MVACNRASRNRLRKIALLFPHKCLQRNFQWQLRGALAAAVHLLHSKNARQPLQSPTCHRNLLCAIFFIPHVEPKAHYVRRRTPDVPLWRCMYSIQRYIVRIVPLEKHRCIPVSEEPHEKSLLKEESAQKPMHVHRSVLFCSIVRATAWCGDREKEKS